MKNSITKKEIMELCLFIILFFVSCYLFYLGVSDTISSSIIMAIGTICISTYFILHTYNSINKRSLNIPTKLLFALKWIGIIFSVIYIIYGVI